MEITFLGAAQTVTGSMHLVRAGSTNILLDCGLFQGRRRESFERNRHLPVNPRDVDVVVLSHAHIDHSGALPMLCRGGFEGAIYVTPATRDLCAVMLRDAAMIQHQDARYINRSIEREGLDMEPVEPLYDERDVVRVLGAMIAVPYRRKVPIAPGVHLVFYDAGHVLGSAITALDIAEPGGEKRLVFTGDLGRRNMPILRDPEVVQNASALITESTYGDRRHDPIEKMDDDLAAVLTRVHERGGKAIIPSFALERAQEIILSLKHLQRQGRMPRMPVYVDSPLTVKVTDIFRLHPDCYDSETAALTEGQDAPFDFEGLRYVSEREDSKAIDAQDSPCVIISASGMCEAGRVLHHLKASIENPRNAILIVGFQAQHTLGRRIVEKRPRVKIFGVERDLRAEVVVLNGFSAHADQQDLVDYAAEVSKHGPLQTVMLVHGEPRPQETLRGVLRTRLGKDVNVHIPGPGDRVTLPT